MNLKSDAEVFTNYLHQLSKESWLGSTRRWWPNYLFHFTDVNNAASILGGDYLYSRSYLDINGGMKNDNASPTVIEHTEDKWKEYVRFYFRPRTPTQYNNEGFRPVNSRSFGGAHCPVPVFFLFKSAPLLCDKRSMFSDGSLAVNSPTVFSTGEEFIKLPFEYIYHDSRYDTYREYYIKYHRHAEVVIPDKCSLEYLEFIVCRSAAERETLLQLLPAKSKAKWANKIILETRLNLFFTLWTFIEKVTLTREEVAIQFNPGRHVIGSFKAELRVLEVATGKVHSWSSDSFVPEKSFSIGIKSVTHPEHYKVKFLLDGQLAYSNEYIDEEFMPF